MKWRQMKDFRFRQWMRIGHELLPFGSYAFETQFCFYLCTYLYYWLFALRKCWLALGSKIRTRTNFFVFSIEIVCILKINLTFSMKIIRIKRKHIETTQLISRPSSPDEHSLTASGEQIGRFKLSTAKVTVKLRQKL